MVSYLFQETYKSARRNGKVELNVRIMQLNHNARLQLVLIHLYFLKVLAKN